MSKLFEIEMHDEEEKCGCCNWASGALYLMAETQEEAQELYESFQNDGGNALCGGCMCNLLQEEGYEITQSI